MATYGFTFGAKSPGSIAFTGFSPTLGIGPANVGVGNGAVYYNGMTQNDLAMSRFYKEGGAGDILQQMLLTLLGAAAGGTATGTKKQVAGRPGDLLQQSGVIPIEVITPINRVTTAADVTALKAMVTRVNFPASYPADLSGNGGGGKSSNVFF